MSPIIRFLLGSTLLCCIGDVRATLIADPGQAVFPPVLVGEVSEPLSVTLTNTGNQSLNVVGRAPSAEGEVQLDVLSKMAHRVLKP